MAHLKTPPPEKDKVKTLDDFLRMVREWQAKQTSKSIGGFLGQLWYRGVRHHSTTQIPRVYREAFTDRAERLNGKRNTEAKRLHLEREMLAEFRSAGAAFLSRLSPVEIYFAAQHFGMPTRLLDWSTNPLAGLFFACDGQLDKDGVVYAMDARKVIPPKAMRTTTERLYQAVMTMRHPFVGYAVGLSFWDDPKDSHKPHVLPVRPDRVPGRIGQQSSCFTLHMHGAAPATNDSLITISIDKDSKETVRDALHQLNINQFTVYHDLDHLSKEIKRCWGLGS